MDSKLATLIETIELGYFEIGEAFKGLQDENVWKRPAEGLLSIGEIAGHIAFWEANKFAGEGSDGNFKPDVSKCKIQSPLVDVRFDYYPHNLPGEIHLDMTAEQVHSELVRVHKEAMASLEERNPGPDETVTNYPKPCTYAEFLKYATFHIAYHTGQIYSARHLLGETPPDN